MPRWPTVEPAAKRARKNASKETANSGALPDSHPSVAEVLMGVEVVPLSVREMLCAGLDGCLADSGKAMPRHSYQDKLLDAVVDAMETAEIAIKTEVSEAEAALEASQAAMVQCEGARPKLEFELAESKRSIEGHEKSLEDNADALDKTRHDLGVAEVALRHADTEIGEVAMRSHQLSRVLHLVKSLSEKGAPDGEATKFLHDSRHLLEPCADEHAAKASCVDESAAERNAGKESLHDSGEPEAEQLASEQHLVSEQPIHSQSEELKEDWPPSCQLAEELSRFSKSIASLDNVVSQIAAARIWRVAEVTDAQSACSIMLSQRSEQSSELQEAKQAYRQSEASVKTNAKDIKQIAAKCKACIENRDNTHERLKELQQGPLAKCRGLVATTTKVFANHSVNVGPQQESKSVHAEPGCDVEMRLEWIKAGC